MKFSAGVTCTLPRSLVCKAPLKRLRTNQKVSMDAWPGPCFSALPRSSPECASSCSPSKRTAPSLTWLCGTTARPWSNYQGKTLNIKMTSWRCLTCWHVKFWHCKMMSLVNKSADWPPNYHKILIFFPTKIFEKVTRSQNRSISWL